MPQAIPLIIVAVGAAVGTATAIAIAQVAAMAAAMIIASQQAKKAKKGLSAQSRENQITIQSATEAHRTIYGRAKVGGPVVFATSEGPEQKYLHRVIVVAGHEIDAWERFYLNDDELVLPGLPATADYSNPTTGGRYMENGLPVVAIETRMGTASQSAMSIPGGQWTADHRCLGRALMRVQTNYTHSVFTEGLPNPSTVIRGKKLYDGRSGTSYWSRNPALVIRDYLTSVLNVDAATIDQASFDAAANVCDEQVTIDTATTGDPAGWAAYLAAASVWTWQPLGGTTYAQNRYTCNGVVPADVDPGEVLAHMVASCAGYLSYTGGMYRLVAGSYTAPTLTLTEKDLRGPVTVRPRPGRRDRYNEARGTFIGPLNQWAPTDFPIVKSSLFVAADGGEVAPLDLDYPFTDDAVAAQRLATIALLRSRQGTVVVPCTLTALALRPGDTVALTLPALGFNADPFRVEGWEFTQDFGINLTLREESAAVYAWLPDITIKDPSPNLNLPSPWNVPALVGLFATSGVAHQLVQNDGTIIQRTRISWTTTTNAFNRFVEIQTRQVGETIWTSHGFATDSDGFTYLLNLKTSKQHEIQARRVNSVAAFGAWATIVYTPLAANQVENMLRNANWAEELGYAVNASFVDTRSLRHWFPGVAAAGALYGRNYNQGLTWNLGRGGMWMYANSVLAGQYMYCYQWVPVVAGVEYEVQVRVNNHRSNAYFQCQWFAANQATSTGTGIADNLDAGGAVIGDAYQFSTHPKLWCKGVAPPGTFYALVFTQMIVTSATGSPPYTFWHQAMMNVAPPGVTRDTATPWQESGIDTVDGQLQQTYQVGLSPGTGVHGGAEITHFTFTPIVGGSATVVMNANYSGIYAPTHVFGSTGICYIYWRVYQNGVLLVQSEPIVLNQSGPISYTSPGGTGTDYGPAGAQPYSAERSVTMLPRFEPGLPVQVRAIGVADPRHSVSFYQTDYTWTRITVEMNRKVI